MKQNIDIELYKMIIKIGIILGQANPNIDPEVLCNKAIELQQEAMDNEM